MARKAANSADIIDAKIARFLGEARIIRTASVKLREKAERDRVRRQRENKVLRYYCHANASLAPEILKDGNRYGRRDYREPYPM